MHRFSKADDSTAGITALPLRRLIKIIAYTGLAALYTLVTSCASTPYGVSIASFNERPPQTKAAILLSDPQIYSRETLINDRMEERKFIRALLEETKKPDFCKSFKPSLARDLESITAITASVKAAFNPGLGRANSRQEELDELGQEQKTLQAQTIIAQEKLKLLKAQQAYDAALAPSSDPADVSSDGGDGSGNGGASGSDASSPAEVPALPDTPTDRLEKAQLQLTETLKRMRDRASDGAVERAGISSDPLEQFRDCQAYRQQLRQALSEVELDDLHDHDGNSLYRMQYRATVLPGKEKAKFGVAQITLAPPIVTGEELESLYFSWMMHLASRLNLGRASSLDRSCPPQNSAFLGLDHSKLMSVMSFRTTEKTNVEKVLRQGKKLPPPDKRKPKLDQQLAGKNLVYTDQSFPFVISSYQPQAQEIADAVNGNNCYYHIPIPRVSDQPELDSTNTVKLPPKAYRYVNAVAKYILSVTQRDNPSAELFGICEATRDCTPLSKKFTEDKKHNDESWPQDYLKDFINITTTGELIDPYHIEEAQQYKHSFEISDPGVAGDQIYVVMENKNNGEKRYLSRDNFKLTFKRDGLLKIDVANNGNKKGARNYEVWVCNYSFLDINHNSIFESKHEHELPYGGKYKHEHGHEHGQDQKHTHKHTHDVKRQRNKEHGHTLEQSASSVFDGEEFATLCRDAKTRYFTLDGDANVYQTAPAEQAQRISTVSRSAKSLELAMAAAGSFPSAGVSVEGRAGYLRQAAGAIETLERQPIVVGFAERKSFDECNSLNPYASELCPADIDKSLPIFGWVFGPHVQANPKGDRLELVQRPAAHDVAADISAPGWWPFVIAELETAWVANWWNTGDAIKNLRESALVSNSELRRYGGGSAHHSFQPQSQRNKFDISLPIAKADYDGLTAYLINQTVGAAPDIMKIERVTPYFLTACQEEVSLAITGVNIWRSTRIMLGGVEIDEVEILPDMEGVLAKVKMSEVYGKLNNKLLNTASRYQYLPLTVWTREGKDETTIPIYGLRKNVGDKTECKALDSVATETRSSQFRIHNVTPAEVSACGQKTTFFVKLDRDDGGPYNAQRLGKKNFLLDGMSPISASRVPDANLKNPTTDNTPIYAVTFKGGVLAKGAPKHIATLSASDGDSTSSASVEIAACATAKAATKSTSNDNDSKKGKGVKIKEAWIIDQKPAATQEKEIDFTLTITHPDSINFNNNKYRAGLLPATAATGVKYVTTARAPALDSTKKFSTAAFGIVEKGLENVWADFDSNKTVHAAGSKPEKHGAKLNVMLLDITGGKQKVERKLGSVIYYPTEDDRHVSSFAISKAFVTNTPMEFDLYFPKFATEAYPDITKYTVEAYLEGYPKIKLKTAPIEVKIDKNGKMRMKIEFEATKRTRTPTSIDAVKFRFLTPGAPLQIK